MPLTPLFESETHRKPLKTKIIHAHALANSLLELSQKFPIDGATVLFGDSLPNIKNKNIQEVQDLVAQCVPPVSATLQPFNASTIL